MGMLVDGTWFDNDPPPDRTGRATLALKAGGVVSSRELFDAATPSLPGFELAPGFRF